jgi:NhaP-type Na+/H+ or K+/H+ antiporter
MFAFAGTLISSVFVGSMIYACGSWSGLELSYINSMVLGSLLSAVDPVSTISVFSKAGVKVGLYTLVFGESVLNDAVAIVVNRYAMS